MSNISKSDHPNLPMASDLLSLVIKVVNIHKVLLDLNVKTTSRVVN